jgi:hypothetical protein
MDEQHVSDDASHYEISLTPGQAFIAFILLLCSLGAAFAFGIMVGRGQLDERLVVQREPAVIAEGTAGGDRGRIVELGVDDDFGSTAATETAMPEQPTIEELAPGSVERGAPAPVVETAPPPAPPSNAGPVFAQVLSSSEAKPAESLAAKLIENGFTSAYVERVPTGPAGAMIYRVRVRFPTEQEARGAVERLKGLSGGGDVWITKQ